MSDYVNPSSDIDNSDNIVYFFRILKTNLNTIDIYPGRLIFCYDTGEIFMDIPKNNNTAERKKVAGTYGLSINDRNVTLTIDDSNNTITLPEDTTYTFIQDQNDGHKIIITPSTSGSTPIILTIPDNDTTYIFETGDNNGTFKVTSNGGSAQNIAIKNVATLDENGKVFSSQLPSYVDDIIEGYYYNNKFYEDISHTIEITGETGKIYVDLNTEKTYRYSGSGFVVISETLALGTTSSTAYRGDYGNVAYLHATDANKLTTATASGLYKIAATSDGHIQSLTAIEKNDITGLGIPAQDTNTTYTLTQDPIQGNILTFTPSEGVATTITIPVDGEGNIFYWNGLDSYDSDNLTLWQNIYDKQLETDCYVYAGQNMTRLELLKIGKNSIGMDVTNRILTSSTNIYMKKENGISYSTSCDSIATTKITTSQGEVIFVDSLTHEDDTTSKINYLDTNINYSTPYTPTYDGSPATKKYVDDSIPKISYGSTIPTSLEEGEIYIQYF